MFASLRFNSLGEGRSLYMITGRQEAQCSRASLPCPDFQSLIQASFLLTFPQFCFQPSFPLLFLAHGSCISFTTLLPSTFLGTWGSRGSQTLPSWGCQVVALSTGCSAPTSILPAHAFKELAPKQLRKLLKGEAKSLSSNTDESSDGYWLSLFSFDIYGYRPHKDPCGHHSVNFWFSSDL